MSHIVHTGSIGKLCYVGKGQLGLILSSQVVSLPLQFVIQEVENFCAAMDTLIDQDG